MTAVEVDQETDLAFWRNTALSAIQTAQQATARAEECEGRLARATTLAQHWLRASLRSRTGASQARGMLAVLTGQETRRG